jgi:hypothetical protein
MPMWSMTSLMRVPWMIASEPAVCHGGRFEGRSAGKRTAAGRLGMENAAAPPDADARKRRLRAFAGDVGPKLFITIVAAGITALLIPWITGKWQDHKQQLEVRTSLASDMSRAYTDVIASERFVAFGLVYSAGQKAEQVATNANAWLTAWHNWLVEAGTLGAQLTARYGVDGIAAKWREYAGAISSYIRLGAEVPAAERPGLIAVAKRYVGSVGIDWSGLEHTRKLKSYPDFKSSYTALGNELISRGDALVEEELRLTPNV